MSLIWKWNLWGTGTGDSVGLVINQHFQDDNMDLPLTWPEIFPALLLDPSTTYMQITNLFVLCGVHLLMSLFAYLQTLGRRMSMENACESSLTRWKKELWLFCNLSPMSHTQQSGAVRRSLKALEMTVYIRSVGKEEGRERFHQPLEDEKLGRKWPSRVAVPNRGKKTQTVY